MINPISELIIDLQEKLVDLGYRVAPNGRADRVTINALVAASSGEGQSTAADGTDKVLRPYFNTNARPFVSWDRINEAIAKTDATPEEINHIKFFLRKENRHNAKGIYVEMKKPYVGLGQFSKSTWEAVSDKPYEYSAETDDAIQAILNLDRSNRRVYRNQFRTSAGYTPEVGYLYHNQGAGAAKQFLKTGKLRFPGQSKAALASFESINREMYT